jgi:hypothetical protein
MWPRSILSQSNAYAKLSKLSIWSFESHFTPENYTNFFYIVKKISEIICTSNSISFLDKYHVSNVNPSLGMTLAITHFIHLQFDRKYFHPLVKNSIYLNVIQQLMPRNSRKLFKALIIRKIFTKKAFGIELKIVLFHEKFV